MTESNSRIPGTLPAESLTRVLAGESVRVGTENQAKCGAVRMALATLNACATIDQDVAIQIVPVGVESGVSEQPVGYPEISRGARNRARAAWESGACALAVGIEDGLVRIEDGLRDARAASPAGAEAGSVYNVGCAWVTDGEREGVGYSSGFAYPGPCAEPAVADQEPIGDLFDAYWRATRDAQDDRVSGRSEGNIGKLTGGSLTRADYGSQAVACALIRFLQRDLYD